MNTRAQQQRRPSSVVSKTSTPNESKPQPHPKTLVPYASDTQVAEHGIRIFVVCIAAAVVCIHTEIMTQTMGQKQSRNSAVEEFFLVSTSKNAQTAQPISLLSFVNFPCRGYLLGQRQVVVDVVQSSGAGAGSTDTAVCLFAAAVADAGTYKSAHEFSLVACVFDHTHDFCEVPIGLFERQEGDVR
ncbi:hypothetical protein KCV06_g316, partial [Aureobasidium melanogenum]